jgi:hypothetical protein
MAIDLGKDSSAAQNGLPRLSNFINGLSFGVDCSKSARNEEHLHKAL